MVADVNYDARNLPDRWKARLREQPDGLMAAPEHTDQKGAPTSGGVVIEPTEPNNAHGLPAFKIKQEIEPQPVSSAQPQTRRWSDVRIGVVIALTSLFCLLAVFAAFLVAIL